MAGKGAFHLFGARLELGQQVAMPALEIFQDLRQLDVGLPLIQCKTTINDMIGPRLVRGIEIARFRCRFEGPYNNPGRIWPKIKSLPVQKLDLRQMAPSSLPISARCGAKRGRNFARLSASRLAWRISA